jgi:hypothetical protein
MCERPDIYEEKFVVAKKGHKCYECGRTIPVNEKYIKIKGLWDSKWSNYNYCRECIRLRTYLEDDFSCLAIGELYMDLTGSPLVCFDEETQTWESGDENIFIESQEPLLVKVKE